MSSLLMWGIVLYLGVMFCIALLAQNQLEDVDDYLVAGRRLGYGLSTLTLLATWFGAGTLLTATDEVARVGLSGAVLDPIGAGLCLIIAGCFFAKPLWQQQLTTLSDFFRLRFGPSSEKLSGLLMIPTYLGWIAAQFLALSHLLHGLFDWPIGLCLVGIAVIGTAYTLLGGMWAVTLTDAVQMVLLSAGLILMLVISITQLGEGQFMSGITAAQQQVPTSHWSIMPEGFGTWLGILAAGSLGNLASQDILQRIFAARSAQVAARACLTAGALYLVLGCIPITLGLIGPLRLGGQVESIIPALATHSLSDWLALVFVLTIISAVLSTIDSAILAPASVLARNILSRHAGQEKMSTHRWAAIAIAAVSLLLAFAGEDAYSLLEDAYELGLVALFIPLVGGLFAPHTPKAGLLSLSLGSAAWLLHWLLGAESFLQTGLNIALICTLLSVCGYGLGLYLDKRSH